MAENGTGTETTTTPKKDPPEARTVPWERFKQINDKVKTTEAEVERLNGELTTVTSKAATADTLAEQIEKLKGDHKGELGGLREELALVRAGVVEPDDAEAVRFHYGRVPAEGRPKTVVEYVEALRKGADGAEGGVAPPKGLSYLFAPKPKEEPGKTEPAKTTMPKTTTTTTGAPPPAGEPLSADAIRALRQEAQRTGDWAKVAELMPQLEKAIQKRG